MGDGEQKNSNLNGLLLAIAAVITALGGFIAIFINHDTKQVEKTPAVISSQPSGDTVQSETPRQPAPIRKLPQQNQPAAVETDATEPNFADINNVIGAWHPTSKDQAMTLHLTFKSFHNSGYMDSPCAGVSERINLETATFSENVLQISYRNVQTNELVVSRFLYKNHQLKGGVVGAAANDTEATATLVRGTAACAE